MGKVEVGIGGASRDGGRGYPKSAEEGDDGRKKMSATNVINAHTLRLKVPWNRGRGAELHV